MRRDVPKDMKNQQVLSQERKWQPRALTKKNVMNNASHHANGFTHGKNLDRTAGEFIGAPLKGRAKRKTVSLRAYLQALRDRRWRDQQISPPLRVSRSRTDHSRLALRTETEKSLSYPKIADKVIESNLLGKEEKCPANLRVNEKR